MAVRARARKACPPLARRLRQGSSRRRRLPGLAPQEEQAAHLGRGAVRQDGPAEPRALQIRRARGRPLRASAQAGVRARQGAGLLRRGQAHAMDGPQRARRSDEGVAAAAVARCAMRALAPSVPKQLADGLGAWGWSWGEREHELTGQQPRGGALAPLSQRTHAPLLAAQARATTAAWAPTRRTSRCGRRTASPATTSHSEPESVADLPSHCRSFLPCWCSWGL